MAAPPAEPPRRAPRALKNALLLGWLAVQAFLPIRGCGSDRLVDPLDFTWNMYAARSTCQIRYLLAEPGSSPASLQIGEHFRTEYSKGLTFTRRRLPTFHRYLCARLDEDGRLGRLEGRVRCQYPHTGELEIVSPGVDLCTAPNFGVLADGEDVE